MHSGCLRSQVQRAFADTAYRERRPLRPQQVRWAGRAWTCRTCFNSAVPGQPYRSSRPQQTQLHAFRRPPSSSSNEPSFSHSSIVDITAEPATTSGRDSDDDRSPQHRPNIIWRALAAGMGILQAAFQWMRTHLKPWKLFDRCHLYRHLVTMLLGIPHCKPTTRHTTQSLVLSASLRTLKLCLTCNMLACAGHVHVHSCKGVHGRL